MIATKAPKGDTYMQCQYRYPTGLWRSAQCSRISLNDENFCERHSERLDKYEVAYMDFLEQECGIDSNRVPPGLYNACKEKIRAYYKSGSSDERSDAQDAIAHFLFASEWGLFSQDEYDQYKIL